MKYDDMLFNLSSQIKQAPKKTKAIDQDTKQLDSLANKMIGNLLNKLPPQKLDAHATLSIEHDAKHWEGLIEKLKELVITPPSVNISPASINVSAPDNTAIANALIEHGQHMAKLGRLLTQKKSITLNVLRDEDGKIAQIVIEQE
jgi:hypothetical protein